MELSELKKRIEEISGNPSQPESDATLMHLYRELCEIYDETGDYRAIGKVADDVVHLMRQDTVSGKVYEATVPGIIEVLEDTVYLHSLYEILLMYLKKVLAEKVVNPKDVKRYAALMLRLHIVIERGDWRDILWDDAFEKSLEKMFTTAELLAIIRKPEPGRHHRDPVEYTWLWEDIYYDVEDEVKKEFGSVRRQFGMCYRIWERKKQILKEKYGIEWRTPHQMNPRVKFD